MEIYNKVYPLTKNLTVLYAEDNIEFRKYATDIFANFFAKIDLSSNGQECYDKYISYYNSENKYYDLIISDIEMPYLNGIELTKKIYQINKNQKIIIISAYNHPKYLLEFVNIGIDHFLIKPFELEEICDVFMKSLTNKSQLTISKMNICTFSDNLYFNLDSLGLYFNNNEIKLTKKEILFLEILSISKNKVVEYDIIYNYLWEDDIELASSVTLNPILSRLRKKIPIDIIQSIYGIGYKISG